MTRPKFELGCSDLTKTSPTSRWAVANLTAVDELDNPSSGLARRRLLAALLIRLPTAEAEQLRGPIEPRAGPVQFASDTLAPAARTPAPRAARASRRRVRSKEVGSPPTALEVPGCEAKPQQAYPTHSARPRPRLSHDSAHGHDYAKPGCMTRLLTHPFVRDLRAKGDPEAESRHNLEASRALVHGQNGLKNRGEVRRYVSRRTAGRP